MKKTIPAIIALFAVLCGGFVFLRREEPYRARAMEIAPAEAILFAHLPDLRRTAQRWPATALAQLWREPEMQAFFAQPLEKMPTLVRAQEHWERLRGIGAREAFVAAVDFDGPTPKFIAGLSFSGSKSEVAALVAEPWAEWKRAWPAGRSELLHRPKWEIETCTFEDKLLAGSFHAGWYFIANDLRTLEEALARCTAGTGRGIGSTAALQRAAAPLPSECDAFVFAQTGGLLERLGALFSAAGAPPVTTNGPDAMGPMAWSVKLEGPQIRDTIYFTEPKGAGIPLARSTQALTSPESLLYAACILPAQIDLPPVASPFLALLAASPALALPGEPISWPEFIAAFGPECGVVLDWPAAADAPSLSFVFAVRDSTRAADFVQTLTGPAAKGPPWEREEHAGVIHYRAPADRKAGTTPALALMPKFFVLGAQASAVRAIAARFETRGADVGQNPAFQEIASRVGPATTAFGYLDLPRLVVRSYDALRPFLGMSLVLSPGTAPYFDASKLPTSAAVARHLGPSVYSQSAREDGVFIESVGSLSFSQTILTLAGMTWTSAAPALRKNGSGDIQPAPTTPEASATPRSKSAAKPEKAAESSKRAQNADELSHIRASHP